MEEENKHSHHHHHHHHYRSSSDRFKEHQLRVNRNKKIFSRVLFILGCIIAIAIIIAVVWLYTNE
ncbi:MAG: hypothetical protein I3J02_09190 [Prevotella sp.]|nr:hypothetical protein [Prevotella sp.]